MRGSLCLVASVLVLPTLIGCIGATDDDAAAPTGTDGPSLPDVRPALVDPTLLAPILLGGATIGAEPNIAVAPDGTIYVTTPLHLWRSDDGGKTYAAIGEPYCDVFTLGLVDPPVCPPGFEATNPGLDGGGDGDIAIDGAGNLYWAGLFGEAGAIPFQVSKDRGETWSDGFDVTDGEGADREWLAARPDGTVYNSWRGSTDSSSFIGFRVTRDGGATWEDVVEVGDDGLAGPVVFDPTGTTLYIPFTDGGGVSVARSPDDGKTWENVRVVEFPDFALPDVVGTASFFRTSIFPVASVDEAGTVYIVWSVDVGTTGTTGVKELYFPVVYLSVSKDKGSTWSAPMALSTDGRSAVFPWVAAGKPGRVAIAWYENRLGVPADAVPDQWDVRLIESVTADSDAPEWVAATLNAEPIHLGGICSEGTFCLFKAKDRSLLDFFEVAITPGGQPVVTWAADGMIRGPTIFARVDVYAGGVETGTPLV